MFRIMNYLAVTTEGVSASEAKASKVVSWLESQIPIALKFGEKLIIAILVIFIGHKLIKWAEKLLAKSMKRSSMDEGVRKFLLSMIGVASNIVLVVMTAEIIGFETTSLVALVGSAGLTIGLALQGSLSNFAGGVLILLMKPFRIGDYIISLGNEGTVTSIDIFYTRLLTADNRMVVIPNGILSNTSIVNVTNEPIRRMDLTVSVNYTENITLVKEILLRLGQEHPLRLVERDAEVFMNTIESAVITLGVRVWVKKEDYWTLKWELLEQIKMEFEKNKIATPLQQFGLDLASMSRKN